MYCCVTSPVQRRNVQRMKRRAAQRGNPMRALASKGESTYVEHRLHAGERELRRNKVEECKCSSERTTKKLANVRYTGILKERMAKNMIVLVTIESQRS